MLYNSILSEKGGGKMYNDNIALMTDSYKLSHYLQYPPETTLVHSYVESRGGKYPEVVFFGLQYILSILEKGITKEDVEEAREISELHGLPFNYDGFMYIVNELEGKLPVRIKAIPEGTVVPVLTPLMTVENTDPKCYWLTTYLETMLLRVWYPITVATQSYHTKQMIMKYLEKTSDDPEGEIPFKLHDFGARGTTSGETAGIGGLAHLVNFMGSDTIEALRMGREFYDEPMAGISIPASEHSTMTAWGRGNEIGAYTNMLDQFAKPEALLAVVSDSYNIYKALKMWGTELKDKIIESGATVVIRLDSGEPLASVMDALNRLHYYFGVTLNSKGYKVLNNVRILQGDGVNPQLIEDILDTMESQGYSATNIAFGMGGALLQQVNRDTQRFAMKASYVEIGGEGIAIYKDPVSDPGKVSKKGRQDKGMETVFENGRIVKRYTLEQVRANSNL